MNINKIIDLQKRNRITQKELATFIGMSKTNLNNFLTEKQELKVVTLEKIAAYFKVPVGYFFDECEATGFVGGNKIVQTANGHVINQTIGEMECHKNLEVAQEKIRGLEGKIKVLEDLVEVLKNK